MFDSDLTPDLYFAAEITKAEEQPDGSVMVYGCPANPEQLDNDDQIADEQWLRKALPEWFHSYGNVREMHQPSAVGAARKLDWKGDKPQVAAKVVDPVAATKVREGVYKAFSIGVKKPETRYDRKARGGRIVGGKIVEVSLVDRPSIPGSDIESFKAAVASGYLLCKAVGANEWLDTQSGVVIADTQADASLAAGGDMAEKTTGADVGKRDFDPDVGGGVDRDKLPDSEFVFPDERDFPVVEPGDVSDAVSSWGRYRGERSFDEFKRRLTALAERKGDRFAAQLPTEWKQEKAAAADDAKGVEASIDSVKEATPEMDDQEKTVDAETAKTDQAEAEKADALEKQAGEEAYCAKCGGMQKIVDGHEQRTGNQRMLVGKDAHGHELRKYLGKADDADEKAAEAEAGKEAEAEKAAEAEKTDTVDAAKDGGDELDESYAADADKTVEALAKVVQAGGEDALKAVLGEVLADALGIDLGKIGRKMASKRLEKFNAAIDELKAVAAELTETADADAGKSAGVGGPSPVADADPARTRMVACLNAINQLARELVAGNGTFDLEAAGHEGHDMGAADQIRIKERIDTNEKTQVPDLTKTATVDEVAKVVGPELAKSVAQEISGVLSPLVERLEQVEHTVRPASPPILVAAERGHALQPDTTKAALSDELLKADLEKRLAGVPDQQREELLATVLQAARGWR